MSEKSEIKFNFIFYLTFIFFDVIGKNIRVIYFKRRWLIEFPVLSAGYPLWI